MLISTKVGVSHFMAFTFRDRPGRDGPQGLVTGIFRSRPWAVKPAVPACPDVPGGAEFPRATSPPRGIHAPMSPGPLPRTVLMVLLAASATPAAAAAPPAASAGTLVYVSAEDA